MTNPHSTSTDHDATEKMAEPDVIDIRSIVQYAVALAVVTAMAQFGMVLTYNAFARSTDASNPPRVFPLAVDSDSRRPPMPRLQDGAPTSDGRLLSTPPEHNPGPREALRELRAEEDAILDGYAWVDRNGSVVRIPIAEAMKLALQRGFPARENAAAPAGHTQEQGKEQGK